MLSELRAPGVYIREGTGPRPIQAVGTNTAGFVGVSPKADAHVNDIKAINNWSQFKREYAPEGSLSTDLSHAVYGFFLNGGGRCYVVNIASGTLTEGLDQLKTKDEIAIVAAPGFTDPMSYNVVIAHCELMKDRVGILDSPKGVTDIDLLTEVGKPQTTKKEGEANAAAGLRPRMSDKGMAAFYFPWIMVADPLPPGELVFVPPSGHVAGIWARSDATRGVHKAPANETIRGAQDLSYQLTHEEQKVLNPKGVNCIRFFTSEGIRVWGARTLATESSEWRYLNVRRLFNMIEESIANSTRWIVFEPNDRPLWQAVRRDVGAFLTALWRDGALMGRTADEAFFVKCDEETNPPELIERGIVTTEVGIAPVKPAEFVLFRISQYESGSDVEVQGG